MNFPVGNCITCWGISIFLKIYTLGNHYLLQYAQNGTLRKICKFWRFQVNVICLYLPDGWSLFSRLPLLKHNVSIWEMA